MSPRQAGAGLFVAALAIAGGASADEAWRARFEDNRVEVTHNGQAVLTYNTDAAPYKPFAGHFASPSGANILRVAPADHPHHHGLMFAITVDGVNFWEEHDAPGRQIPGGKRRLEAAAPGEASYAHDIDWLAPDEDVRLLHERRRLRLQAAEDGGGPNVLTWSAELAAPTDGAARELGGAHYHGLGARLQASFDGAVDWLTPAGALGPVFRGDERLTDDAPWMALHGEAGGAPITVAMFCHEANPRHPATWFTMAEPFAYLSATLKLHEEPLALEPGAAITLTYGVALWDGHVSEDVIRAAYADWTEGLP